MRAWRVCELGDPEEALKLEEVEDPSPGPGEVVVEVEAAALNFFDILLCRGEYQERPGLGEVVPFEEVPQALTLLGSRSTRGKVVTRPGV